MTTARAPGSRAIARHYLPGGRETGGGIGRLVGYIAAEAGAGRHLVVDTRGPRWEMPRSLFHLVAALATLLIDRVAAPARIQHIHVAGRGSTARKLLLTGLARTLRSVHLLHLHDFDYAADLARRPAWQRRLIGRMFRGATRVVVLGARDRETVIHDLGVAPDRVVVLPNAVPDPGDAPPPAAAVPLIVFLGTLGERKGVPDLLAALADPAMRDRAWRAVLAGDGAVGKYTEMAASLGLADRVRMPGWLDGTSARALRAQADILVLPSHGEGLAMAVLEGLAHGLAVVTTRVGAHEEVIRHGRNGLFVPVGDPAALAATLTSLLDAPAERARLGAAARASYLEEFSMIAYMHGLDALYASLPRAAAGAPVAAGRIAQ